ncbi:hypothetical protein AB0M39_38245 [Streptomyces sp. NPDC051907]|uniref:hypothetical protein n=1 Tax=Streptomyces sp. NPDC051907 TaxID=3155284 RepID=UPI00342B2B34
MTADEGARWARTVIDYPAAERLFDRMAEGGLIVGREAWQWKEMGLPLTGVQGAATYYATARRAVAVADKKASVQDDDAWEQAGELADTMLRGRHPEEFERLRREAYDALRKGEATP